MIMKRHIMLTAVTLLAWGTARPAVYSWNRAGSQSWVTSTNWTPARSTPAAGDTLRFANGSLDTITDLPTQTIARLEVANNTTARLMTSGGSHTLTIGGSLQVEAGSSFDPSATSQTNTVLVTLASGASGAIDGSMLFQGANHKLDAVSAGAIHFRSGSSCTQDTMVGGNLFTTAGTANAVYFDSGSVFNFKCNQGANPFGLTQPSSKVVFSHGSLYRHLKNILPSFSGRTYADFELDCPTANFSATGTGVCSFDTLRILSGRLKLNLTRRINILGNTACAGGAADSLYFNPASACSLVLCGTSVQTIRGTSPLVLSANENLFINNAAGIILQRPLTINAALNLISGTVITGNDTLSVASDNAVARTSGYVIGNLNLRIATSYSSKLFPVGTVNGYSPAQLDFNYISTAGMLNFQAVQDYCSYSFPAGTATNSIKRYWLCKQQGLVLDYYSVRLYYLADDFNPLFTEPVNESSLVISKFGLATYPWYYVGNSFGGSDDGGSIAFGYDDNCGSGYAIARVSLPISISLSSLSAACEGGCPVVRWRTESECGVLRWIIARSEIQAGPFTELSQIDASGNSSAPHEYCWTDAGAEEGQTYYYRLTGTDLSGHSTVYGPVAAVNENPRPRIDQLLPNRPNPFKLLTTIDYQVSKPGLAVLKVYNIAGQIVRTLAETQAPGYYSRTWDGRNQQGQPVPNGIYIYRLSTGQTEIIRKMTLIR